MKIVVCVKQVPAKADSSVSADHGRPDWTTTEVAINPFDTYALEQGVLLKEKHGGEVIALSMGHPRAEETLREALACGADSAILLTDDAFEQSDSLATAYVLAKAVEKIGDVDLVICGKQAIDGDTAQVGPSMAEHLSWPHASYVSAMPESTEKTVTVARMQEYGYDVCELTLPALFTVVKDINSPRIPSLRGRMNAKKAEITKWNAEALGVDTAKVGPAGSASRVAGVRKPERRDRSTRLIEGDAAECARKLFDELAHLTNR